MPSIKKIYPVSSSVPWQEELAQGFKDPGTLLTYLGLSIEQLNISWPAHKAFKTLVPRHFVDKMIPGDKNDPLLQQVLPISEEMVEVTGYFNDPLAELTTNPVPGLLHKYPSRVLLTITSGCAINCRYCFRRHFDYKNNTPGRSGLNAMLDYIRSKKEIKEVILSGGDPLLLQDDLLTNIIEQIADIHSVEILRIHTRMPIVLPTRITTDFIALLQKTRLQTVCVVHCNHPNELDDVVRDRMLALRNAGTHVLNQSVLLKGINDNVETLCQLSHQLLQNGILPYYLHVLDKVQGAAHFDVDEKTALSLHHAMREQLPGYLLPKLVREVAGESSKMPVTLQF